MFKKSKCQACGNKRQVIENLLIEIGELNSVIAEHKKVLKQVYAEMGIIQVIAQDALKTIRGGERELKLDKQKKSIEEV